MVTTRVLHQHQISRWTLLHGVTEEHVLLCQFQQHRVVKELVDAHILTQSLQMEFVDLLAKYMLFKGSVFSLLEC